MTDLEARLREVDEWLARAPWKAEVPSIPDTPMAEWGTLAWARLAADVLRRLSQAEDLARHQAREIDDYERRLSELEQALRDYLAELGGEGMADARLRAALSEVGGQDE